MSKFELMTKYIPLINEEEFGKWVIDRKNDGTPEHSIQMPFVKYSEMVDSFVQDVHKFEKMYPEMRLNRYGEILNKHKSEWGIDSMNHADISKLDGQCVMALIMGAVRSERFCDGALPGFFKSGSIQKWLERLQEIDSQSMEHIKVNLPRTLEDFNSGNGEGCWILVDEITKQDHDRNCAGGVYEGILDNDSYYYPGLKAGETICFKMCGENRPVAFIEKLVEKFTPLSDDEFSQLLEKIKSK